MKVTSVLPLWLFPLDSPLKEISTEEEKAANLLSEKRSKEYKHARGNARFVLSTLLNINPLEIPLLASPGQPPILENNLGFVSFSHCSDALLIAWSPNQLGIDLERTDRRFAAERIANRFFNVVDRQYCQDQNNEQFRKKILNQWILKEALIKWQQGKLSKDLKKWNINHKSNFAIHTELNYKVKIYTIHYQSWTIGIASNQDLKENNLIVCSE